MSHSRVTKVTRRNAIGLLGATVVGSKLISAPAIAQGLTQVRMTLPWLPQGSQFFAFVAKHRGMWRSRGLDVEIVRGFGSVPALQTITGGQIPLGLIAAPTVMLAAAQGAQCQAVGVIGYDATMGVIAAQRSVGADIKSIEGHLLGSSPGAAELAFIDPYLERSGVDGSKVKRVSLQANVLESSLLNGQVDAITGFATSNLPNFIAQKFPFRFFSYGDAGLTLYSNALTTTPEYLAKNRSVVEAWAGGLVEATKFCMLHFDEAVDDFIAEVPQIKITPTGPTFARLGAGFFLTAMLKPELTNGGIGWADPQSLEKQADLIIQFAANKDSVRPDTRRLFTNDLIGHNLLSADEMAIVEANTKPFLEILNSTK